MKTGYVYIAKVKDFYKIGFTANPFRRMGSIAGNLIKNSPQEVRGCTDSVTLIGLLPGGADLESELHKRAEYWRVEGTNEWFHAAEGMDAVIAGLTFCAPPKRNSRGRANPKLVSEARRAAALARWSKTTPEERSAALKAVAAKVPAKVRKRNGEKAAAKRWGRKINTSREFAALAKKRWEGTTKAQRSRMMSEAGKLGGRPRLQDRCACGAMSKARANREGPQVRAYCLMH